MADAEGSPAIPESGHAAPDPSDGRLALAGALTGLALFLIGSGRYVHLDAVAIQTESQLLQESFDVAKVVMATQTSLNNYLQTREPRFQKDYLAGLGRLTQETDQLKSSATAFKSAESIVRTVNLLNATLHEWDVKYARTAIGLRNPEGKDRYEKGTATKKLTKINEKGVSARYAEELSNHLQSLDKQLEEAAKAYRIWMARRKYLALGFAGTGLVLLLGTGWVYIRRRHVMYEHLRSRSARLGEIADFERRLHHITSADMAARHLRAAAGRTGSRCAVLLRRDHGPGLRVADESGPAPQGTEHSAVLLDHALCPVIRTGSRFLVRDVADIPACECPIGAPKSGGYLCEPLLARGQIAGLVNWQAGPRLRLRDRDIDHVEELSRATSLVLSNLFTLEGAQHDANTDPLTGVHNRRFLDGYLAKQAAIAARQQRPLAVLMLDLDRFKGFNDRHGHPAGDALLRAAAAAMQAQVRDGDVVARYGGEEFTVVLPEADRAAALEIAGRIRSGIETMRVDALPALTPPVTTVSIGLAIAPGDGASALDLLRAADGALYRAKQDGRNRVVEAAAPA